MIKALGILLGFQFIGTLIARSTGIPVPGNVVGMVLLAFVLTSGWLRVEHIEPGAKVLIDNLAFLFVPAGVGIMSYFEVLAAEWLPISLSIVVSLVIVLVVTGRACEALALLTPKRESVDHG